MRKLNRFVLLFSLVSLVSVSALGFVQAQDTPEAGSVQCDSDLILNLYLAERYFGFGGMRNQMTEGGGEMAAMMVDLTLINKGQFTPLFDAAMGMMDENMMMPGSTMTDEQMQGMSDMMMMDDAAMQAMMDSAMEGMDMSAMTMLNPSTMADEAAECSNLRAELNRFFTAVVFQDMAMGMMPMSDSGEAMDMGDMMSWSTTLTGAAEVPGPGDPDGTGTAAVTVDMTNGQVCYTIAVQNITLPAAAGHIHVGAAGVSGGVVVPFDVVPDASGNAASCIKVEESVLSDIAQNPAGFYVNIHTSDFPDGAVRGQVLGS